MVDIEIPVIFYLEIIGSPRAITAIAPLKNDPDPQVAEIVADFLAEQKLAI